MGAGRKKWGREGQKERVKDERIGIGEHLEGDIEAEGSKKFMESLMVTPVETPSKGGYET